MIQIIKTLWGAFDTVKGMLMTRESSRRNSNGRNRNIFVERWSVWTRTWCEWKCLATRIHAIRALSLNGKLPWLFHKWLYRSPYLAPERERERRKEIHFVVDWSDDSHNRTHLTTVFRTFCHIRLHRHHSLRPHIIIMNVSCDHVNCWVTACRIMKRVLPHQMEATMCQI